MSGICSAHRHYEPGCSTCAAMGISHQEWNNTIVVTGKMQQEAKDFLEKLSAAKERANAEMLNLTPYVPHKRTIWDKLVDAWVAFKYGIE